MADYAISNVPRRVVYAASGVGPYAFTFEILSASDIAVYKASTLLTLTTDYSVTINANGTGSVTLVTSAGTSNITIVGAKNIQRTTDFTTGGDFFANTLNDELDAQTIFIQQVAETAERGLKAPVVDPTDINMTLPAKTTRAGTVLAFNATTGNPEVGPTIASVATVAAQSANINTVATNIASVNTVAGDNANINTVAGNNSNISTVAGISANVTTVAGISSNVSTVATNNANVTTVAANIAAVNTNATNIVAIQNASTNATNAANSATAAANSATAAGNAQTAAESARDATLAAFDSFDDRYLGTKTSDPTLDNDGNALLAGALYFNSVVGEMRVYTGSAWVAAYVSGTGFLVASNNLSDLNSVSTARTNLGLGTIATQASSNVSITGGAINGTTLGATTPSSGSFTSLTDSGNLTFTGTGNRILGDFSNATLANRPAFQTSTTNGSTGLVVLPNGTGVVSQHLLFNNSDSTNAGVLNLQISAGDARIVSGITGTGTPLPMTFYTNGVEQLRLTTGGALQFSQTGMRITGDFSNATVANRVMFQTSTVNGTTSVASLPNGTGNVGQFSAINSSDPTNASVLNLSAVSTTDTRIASAITGTGTYLPMTFYTGGSERMRVDTSGNVGIGTSSPAGILDVKGNTNGAVVQYLRNDSTGINSVSIYQMSAGSRYVNQSVSYTGQFVQFVGFSIPNIFLDFDTQIFRNTAGTERMRLDSSGNLLVGTATNTGNARAQFAFSSGNGIGIQNNVGSAANGMIFHYGATSVGSITINTTTTSFNTSSDYRLKENIAPMTGALEKVAALKPCTYSWKADGSAGEGFIAHELAEVVPDAVTGDKDAVNEDGSIKPQGIDTSFLVATLTAAIQEQQQMIEELKAKVIALENA